MHHTPGATAATSRAESDEPIVLSRRTLAWSAIVFVLIGVVVSIYGPVARPARAPLWGHPARRRRSCNRPLCRSAGGCPGLAASPGAPLQPSVSDRCARLPRHWERGCGGGAHLAASAGWSLRRRHGFRFPFHGPESDRCPQRGQPEGGHDQRRQCHGRSWGCHRPDSGRGPRPGTVGFRK